MCEVSQCYLISSFYHSVSIFVEGKIAKNPWEDDKLQNHCHCLPLRGFWIFLKQVSEYFKRYLNALGVVVEASIWILTKYPDTTTALLLSNIRMPLKVFECFALVLRYASECKCGYPNVLWLLFFQYGFSVSEYSKEHSNISFTYPDSLMRYLNALWLLFLQHGFSVSECSREYPNTLFTYPDTLVRYPNTLVRYPNAFWDLVTIITFSFKTEQRDKFSIFIK